MGDDFIGHLLLVVFAHAHEFALNAVRTQKLGGNTGVLGADNIGLLQNGQRAQRYVAKLPMGVATTYNVCFSMLSTAFCRCFVYIDSRPSETASL